MLNVQKLQQVSLWKVVFFAALLFLPFLFVQPVAAYEAKINCVKQFGLKETPKGKLFAVFVADTAKEPKIGNKLHVYKNYDENLDPTTGKEFCIEVNEGVKGINFDDLAKGTPATVGAPWKSHDVYRELSACGSKEGFVSWAQDGPKSTASDFVYTLSQKEDSTCQVKTTGPSKTVNVKKRIRFRFVKEQLAIYFVGFEEQVKAKFDCTKLNKDRNNCIKHSHCAYVTSSESCKLKSALTSEELKEIQDENIEAYLKSKYKAPSEAEYPSQILPPCAFEGTCDDINDIIELFIRFGRSFFGIVGVIAFGFFVYGGFLWVTSFGMEERITQGKQTLVAAILGMIILFSAYLVVDFVLDALQVSDAFRAVGTLEQTK